MGFFACRLHAACTSMWAQDNLMRMFLHARTCHTQPLHSFPMTPFFFSSVALMELHKCFLVWRAPNPHWAWGALIRVWCQGEPRTLLSFLSFCTPRHVTRSVKSLVFLQRPVKTTQNFPELLLVTMLVQYSQVHPECLSWDGGGCTDRTSGCCNPLPALQSHQRPAGGVRRVQTCRYSGAQMHVRV